MVQSGQHRLAPELADPFLGLLDFGASVAVDFGAQGDFDDLRCVPSHLVSS
jgi:hypothetical protein